MKENIILKKAKQTKSLIKIFSSSKINKHEMTEKQTSSEASSEFYQVHTDSRLN